LGGIPSSIPYCNSKGLPVSLQIGNGMYCNSFFSFEICSPVSLYSTISTIQMSSLASKSILYNLLLSLLHTSCIFSLPDRWGKSNSNHNGNVTLTSTDSNTPPGSSLHNGNSAVGSLNAPPLLHHPPRHSLNTSKSAPLLIPNCAAPFFLVIVIRFSTPIKTPGYSIMSAYFEAEKSAGAKELRTAVEFWRMR